MESANRWYFTKEKLDNTPTRKCGIEASKELSYRQQAANFIQDMGQRLQVTQLCINTAIVYMHRFYMFHSFTKLHRNQLAVAALFLAAKVEEQPRKLEHVVRVAHKCLHRGDDLDPKSEAFASKCGELVAQENMMLQTLGFDIAIDHPHTYVVKLIQLVKASKDLAQTSYFMATNSLHLTTMCLQYRPTVVACVCIHLACKWSNWKIEPCSEGKEWYYYVDKSVTPELLEELTKDFLAVLEKSPNRLKRRVGPENNKDGQTSHSKSSEEIVGRVEAQVYDICVEPIKKGDLSPVASTSSSASMETFIKDEMFEKMSEPPVEFEPAVPNVNISLKKPKTESSHPITLAAYRERERQEKKQLLDSKPLHLVSTAMLPESVLPVAAATLQPKVCTAEKLHVPSHKSIVTNQEKLSLSNSEKRILNKIATATSSDLVPHKVPDKINHKNIALLHDSVTSEKVNHLVPKATVAPMPPVNHQTVKISVPHPTTLKPQVQKEFLVPVPDGLKPQDPYVLLTRVDQSQFDKRTSSEPKQHVALPVDPSSKEVVAQLRNDELRYKPSRHAPLPPPPPPEPPRYAPPEPPAIAPPPRPPLPPSDWVNETQTSIHMEDHTQIKHKSKSSLLLQNNHSDIQHSSQGSVAKRSPCWDSAKTNGSKPPEQTPVDVPLTYIKESRVSVKNEASSKHERREKHKHKHSVHSNKDKSSNHVSASTPEQEMPSRLKITIPKEKLIGIRPDGNQLSNVESSRTTIKIKLPKPPVPESSSSKTNSTGPGIKLVLTKDKNAGSYSTSLHHKSDRASRKRDRSPSSKLHNSRSSGRTSKTPKIEVDSTVPISETNTAHLNSIKQANLDMVYNNLAQQPYNHMPYANQPYFQTYCPYPPAPTNNVNYNYPLLPPPPPPQIHSRNSAPPLPRDPPPPLPPQPPMTSD